MMRKIGEKGAINAFAITDLEGAFTFLFPHSCFFVLYLSGVYLPARAAFHEEELS